MFAYKMAGRKVPDAGILRPLAAQVYEIRDG